MARVTILHYDRFTDRRTGVKFEPAKHRTPEGATVIRGVAIVDDDIARAFYVGHDGFAVDGLAPEGAFLGLDMAAPGGERTVQITTDDTGTLVRWHDVPTTSANSTEASPAVSDTPAPTDVPPADEPAPVTPTGRGRSRARTT